MSSPTAAVPHGLLTNIQSTHNSMFIKHLLSALTKSVAMKDTVPALVGSKGIERKSRSF